MDGVNESGGRVTRALRKRLTSVDSDSSSRPGTPVQMKVATSSSKTFTESPLKPRMSRRNSLSGVATPVKTPGKRTAAITSIAEDEVGKASPARRTTRRRSISSEIETPAQTLTVKAPDFDTLTEEHEDNRMTRSKSKSPQQIMLDKTMEPQSANKGRRKSMRNSPVVFQLIEEPEVIVDNLNEKGNADKAQKVEDTTVKSDNIKQTRASINKNESQNPTSQNNSTQGCEESTAEKENLVNGNNFANELVENAKLATPRKSLLVNMDEKNVQSSALEHKLVLDENHNASEGNTKPQDEVETYVVVKNEIPDEDIEGTETFSGDVMDTLAFDSTEPEEACMTPSPAKLMTATSKQGSNKEAETIEKALSPSPSKRNSAKSLAAIPMHDSNKTQAVGRPCVDSTETKKACMTPSPSTLQSGESLAANPMQGTNEEKSIGTRAVDSTEPKDACMTPSPSKRLSTKLMTAAQIQDTNRAETLGTPGTDSPEMEDACMTPPFSKRSSTKAMAPKDDCMTPSQSKRLCTKLMTATPMEDTIKANRLGTPTIDSTEKEEACMTPPPSKRQSTKSMVATPLQDSSKTKAVDKPSMDSTELEEICMTPTLSKRQSSKSMADNPLQASSKAKEIVIPAVDSTEPEQFCMTPSPSKRLNASNKTKAVAFNSQISDDECEKSIYPKTPGSSKTKSFIEINSSCQEENYHDDDHSIMSVDTSDDEIPETQQPSKEATIKLTRVNMEKEMLQNIDENEKQGKVESSPSKQNEGKSFLAKEPMEENDVKENVKTPKEQNYEANITINTSAPSADKVSTATSSKDDEMPQNNTNSIALDIQEEAIFKLKWCNPSVAATGNTKLDTIADEKTVPKNSSKLLTKDETVKKRKKHFLKRAEWNEDEEETPNEDSEDEEAEIASEGEQQEKPYHRKHVFHDDEAMEVDDYESGDSMDSEERREMLDNEIPVDGESIGSHTTDGEDDGDEEESENDSFIVSDDDDDEGEECQQDTDSDDENEEEEEDVTESRKRGKKKTFKRIQRMNDSSSSSDEQDEEVQNKSRSSTKDHKEESDNEDIEKSSKAKGLEKRSSFDTSKLSDSALRLQSEKESDSSLEDTKTIDINKSRQEILRLNQSDRFNKSVRDLNPDVEASPEIEAGNENGIEDSSGQSSETDEKEVILNISKTKKKYGEKSLRDEDIDSEEPLEKGTANESLQRNIRVTAEEEEEGENDENPSDNEREKIESELQSDKENNGSGEPNISSMRLNRSLNLSKKRDSLQKMALQRSFTIGVRISGGEVDTAVFETKAAAEESNPSSSASANEDDTDEAVLSAEDLNILENIKPMPLGNPLVRTKRQSLALPTNPDIEIGTAVPAKKPKRKSLALLSGNDFNPSQSFVHSLELRRAELDRQSSKRKRLSKSFCGTSEGLETSIIDMDAHHWRKRSKLAIDSSFVDSLENLSTHKPKAKHSSTPREKPTTKHDSSISRILSRCDEILEAANRAKLEAKQNYKKSKVKLSKKTKKAIQRQSLSPESKQEKMFAPLTKEFKKKDKVKRNAAVTRALKASADIIMGKPRNAPFFEEDEDIENAKRLPTNIPESVAEIKNKPKKVKKAHVVAQTKLCRNYATSAGTVVETLRTPEKKKKPKIIQLPTGKVCVEPITPTKHSIYSCDGMVFHESPVTPGAPGFNIEFSALDTPEFLQIKDRKRKRNMPLTDSKKHTTFPKPQWTQSGLFVEEEMPRPSHCMQILKKHNQQHSLGNFKQNALFRGDIKRSSTREILQLRERRPLQSNY
uniref:Protein slender lobes n=1 Tax=Stomoxys calcitrans TaxID=35570 RepID=A0A1I8QBH8_STOCA